MKIVKIANLAITVILASFALACVKEQPKEETPEAPVKFTVELNDIADADYAEVVVRHDGQKDATWFGFVTKDLDSPVENLIQAQLANVNSRTLHVGNVQTVALRNLEEFVNYRYVAFGVNSDGERYGEPGNLAFNTSPVFDVTFQAEAGEIGSHEASFSVSHDGIDVLTYMAFVTDDKEKAVKTLASEHFATLVDSENNLKEGVELLKGTSGTVSFDELIHETDYRFIIYGIYDNSGKIISYGTPAEVKFTTPIDLSIVPFSAAISNITTESATATVTYDAKADDLTWYGFVTEDLTSPAATLIAAAVSGLSAEDLQTGKNKAIDLKDLTIETDYRFIATGVKDGKAFGVPADVKFSTLSEAYVNCQFTIVASDITPFGATLTITHNGNEDFTYVGFFTEDFDTAVADLELPANADGNLMTGLEKVVKVENLNALTKYRYVVIGRYNGNEYGHRGEVVFETTDNKVSMSYEEYIGEWKLNGQVFSITQKEAGVSFSIDGLPGSSAARCGTSTLEGLYDSANGLLYVMDQDLAQYNDPSTNNYGPLRDFYAGAKWTTMSNNTQRYWPVYPFRSENKSKIFEFVKLDDGSFAIRGAEGVEASVYGWVILTGSNAGGGNAYSGEIIFPAAVTKFDKQAASYNDFLGQWNFSGAIITIAPKENGSTYAITGIPGQDSIYGDSKEVIANYDSVHHEFYLMEQKLGSFDTADVSAFGSNQYGVCDDFLSGYFPYSSSGYFAYPFNTDAPSIIFTAYLNGAGEVEIIPGSCSYGTFSSFDFIWVIREGENAGRGNNYSNPDNGVVIPEKLVKAGASSSVSSLPKPSATTTPAAGTRAPQPSFFSIAK